MNVPAGGMGSATISTFLQIRNPMTLPDQGVQKNYLEIALCYLSFDLNVNFRIEYKSHDETHCISVHI